MLPSARGWAWRLMGGVGAIWYCVEVNARANGSNGGASLMCEMFARSQEAMRKSRRRSYSQISIRHREKRT